MLAWDRVDRSHVLRAIDECDELGCKSFLSKYGYRPSRTYQLLHGGHEYPSKAILAVAYLHATGQLLRPVRVDGGKWGAARILRKLDFEVNGDAIHATRRRHE